MSTTLTTLLVQLKDADASLAEWKQYKSNVIAEIHKHLPVPAGKQSKTHTLPDGRKVTTKASSYLKLLDKEMAEEQDLHSIYPDAFPKPISFSKTGFNQLSDSEKKKIELSGVLVASTPSLSVEIKA